MRTIQWLLLFCLSTPAIAQQAPWAQSDTAISSHDRVYTADQTSNTVSVIDPAENKLLGVIRLGDPVPGALSPLYKGQLLVHGLGYSPDSKTLAVVSVGSNSVTLIDTATNKVKGVVYVGRSPHEPFFTPNGRELWVTVRGENYVSVIDPAQMKEIRRIELANGPGMTMFGPDGKYAFICSSFTPELAVIDVASHKIVKRLPQVSPFSPNIAVTPENDEVWITLKDVGKVQVFNAKPPFEQKAVLDTGPITNHVNFANNRNGKFAYVTIGGANEVKAFRRGATPELVATIPVGELPHGIWPSGDGSRVYVALENGEHCVAIDTVTNKVIANIPIGQTTQALVYVPNAVPSGSGTENLMPLGAAANTARLHLEAGGSDVARCPGVCCSEFTGPIGSCSNRSERACSERVISSVSSGIQSVAVRKTRAAGGFESKSRRCGDRSSYRTVEDTRNTRCEPFGVPTLSDRYQHQEFIGCRDATNQSIEQP